MRLKTVVLPVPNMDAAVAFYRDVLGLAPASVSPWWSELDTGGVRVALHPAHPGLRVALQLVCPDLEAAVAGLRARGVPVEGPRVEEGMDYPTATLTAPDGATVVLEGEGR